MISMVMQACHIQHDLNQYELVLDDGSPLVLHVPVRSLRLRSGACLVMHHVRHEADLLVPSWGYATDVF
jgi:hypothetical protein